jgi:glutamine amidotransferase
MMTIIDYGIGNLASIKNMLKKIGIPSIITSSAEQITKANKLILPGVGHFAKGMENLERSGLIPLLNEQVKNKKTPILGICLGMQLLTSHSEEGDVEGLNWINARTEKFKLNSSSFKVPHMGWTDVNFKSNVRIAENLYDTSRFYFVHSYKVRCIHEENVLATSLYESYFHSAIIDGNIMGVQFHPEKSHKFGMQLLKNFSNIN